MGATGGWSTRAGWTLLDKPNRVRHGICAFLSDRVFWLPV